MAVVTDVSRVVLKSNAIRICFIARASARRARVKNGYE